MILRGEEQNYLDDPIDDKQEVYHKMMQEIASSRVIIANTNRLRKIGYRFHAYRQFTMRALSRGVNVFDIARTQFPFLLTSSCRPPLLSLELTNTCNLRCEYCYTLLMSRPSGIMTPETFDRVIDDIQRFKIQRVKLIGGEPTQHPRFTSMIGRLARATKYLQLVTNAQWRTQEIPASIINAPVNLIEVSIDAGGKEFFEASRIRGSYDRVLSNLQLLARLRGKSKGEITLNVRLMIRPSTKHHLLSDTKFYKQWADTVMPQNLLEVNGLDNKVDVFTPLHVSEQTEPLCSHPFKCLEVKWDGSIPLCGPNAYAAPEKRIELGNIHTTTLGSAWNSRELKAYRHAHRWRKSENMPACRGCKGV